MLDEGFRNRFADMAGEDEGALDEAARERIFARVRAEGPAIVAQARRRRTWNAVSLVAAAAAVAAGIVVFRHPGSEGTVAKSAVGKPALACATREVAESARAGFAEVSEGTRLDLGAVAVAVAPRGSVVKLAEASPCRTVIELASGSVAIHAKDLGGGELTVHASGGDVVVHGTIFSVTEDERGLSVEVVEGKVAVTAHDDVHSVTTGHRLLLSKVGAAEGPLTPERERAVRAAIGVPEVVGLEALPATAAPRPVGPVGGGAARPAPVARADESSKQAASKPVPQVELDVEDSPAPEAARPAPPTDLLASAEQARRAGDYTQARELYRRAAVGTNVTAEAAWVALARMELSLGHAAQALEATKHRQERFGRGTLSPEALWIDVRSYRQMGDLSRARELASKLVEQWPASPQARAAQQWLAGP